ncbi:hypothetical protein RvY_04776 [Ramazzottius varieornatus]|uniref:FAD-binding FR-type domain-containing protein n=1 Tax=Ramazzottius varieornatus TaxID=947166 RepID=A0A1D1USS8_RAMVA|nr:hypothetical protein RvY_04776 [Ramazzottius varieornatus]
MGTPDARKFYDPTWIRDSFQRNADKILDTPQKKHNAKIAVGVIGGGLGLFVSYKLYRCIREHYTADVQTLKGIDTPVKVKLISKKAVTADTRRLRFALPTPHHTVGVPPGNFLAVTADINGKTETRFYTPIDGEHDDRGHMDLLVKIYPPTPEFPGGGAMSQYLEHLKIGDEISISGPAGLIMYMGNGIFDIKANPKSSPISKTVRRIGMVAGGSGVSAMIPILHKMLNEKSETPKCSLLSTNKTEKDIILGDELTKMASKHRHRLRVWYTVDQPICKDWKYGVGMVGAELLRDWMPKPEGSVLILLCGPKAMVDACKADLRSLHYTEDMIFAF